MRRAAIAGGLEGFGGREAARGLDLYLMGETGLPQSLSNV
jgi:hypothetical protein